MQKFKCLSERFCGGSSQDFDPADTEKVVEVFPWMADIENKQLCPSCVREIVVRKKHPETKLKLVGYLVPYEE